MLRDGTFVVLRPLEETDEERLFDFFRRIPKEDKYYLKEDVVDPKVIRHWADNLDYSRVLPLLAIMDGQIISDGTLHHHRSGAHRHIGEARIVVDPAYRNRGVGRGLLHKLIDIAGDKGLKNLTFEVVADAEEAAKHTAQILGFVPVATFPYHVRDYYGNVHHLIVLERQLLDPAQSADEELQYHAPVF